ncbi:helix-turn-helix domain-containing protein [Lewinella sp. JB7]|uniref:helix-turn-helix domain-containing protein n=1 Tax=Lewinella sp. JB7 TaxID=2962887 RepID=UPI0020C94117|nr:helix-turn-helix domain-containing protein [Lewinella sp. JB7]MCP9235210.1 AAA family ATPase [Lewinella sp. JB7]
MASTPELDLAFDYVQSTGRHLFLTGKAGTGKTTFLHRVRRDVTKRMVVVAPTGVAAINARGVTIHSQFQLPFGVLTPQRIESELRQKRFSREKLRVLKALDLLIIDEISMVRGDVLDAIDAVLRKVRRSTDPFGGVQLLMIGDLHQLPPVVRDHEERDMREHWDTPYFFASRALQTAGYRTIQLSHIFRQRDEAFITLLNRVRNDDLTPAVLAELNQRYHPDFQPDNDSGFITLTSHNAAARRINIDQLGKLPATSRAYRAEISGTFPESMYPNAVDQEFKVGAQVMFNKNDGPAQAYYNGKIGRIVAIEGDSISVRCGEEPIIEVLPVDWENRKYTVDPVSREITEEVIGTYTQHPLRLAWAITIHKSQGLTFDRVVIDAADAFAHGQVYVALSRCKTFTGITLRTRIADRSVKTDVTVQSFSDRAERNKVSHTELMADRAAYELSCLAEIFSFERARTSTMQLIRQLFEHEETLPGDGLAVARTVGERLDSECLSVGRTFTARLNKRARQGELLSEDAAIHQRLRDAARYFLPRLRELETHLAAITISTDNQRVAKALKEGLQAVSLEIYTKISMFRLLERGFSTTDFVRIRSDAEAEFQSRRKSSSRVALPPGVEHAALYRSLVEWRARTAKERGRAAYAVAPTKVLVGIATRLPTQKASLLAVPGFGKSRFAEFGAAILDMVTKFAETRQLATDRNDTAGVLPLSGFDDLTGGKRNSDQVSLALFQEGMQPEEIARARQLREATVINHLAGYIMSGEVAAERIISPEALETITPYFQNHEPEGLKEAYLHFGEVFDYSQLRVAEREWHRRKHSATLNEENREE